MKLIYWQNKKGEWNWHLQARNGQIICQSNQGYTRKSRMLSMLDKVFPTLYYKQR